MKFIDYYKVLDVDKKATQEDIKKTYRKLPRKHHGLLLAFHYHRLVRCKSQLTFVGTIWF